MSKKSYVIIGNSAAGIGAVESIRKHDRDVDVTVLTDEGPDVYTRCLLADYMSGRRNRSDLRFRPSDFYKRMNVRMLAETKVEAVEPEKQQVICQNGKILKYDELLIATGASAKMPSSIPAHLQGIFVLRTLQDAESVKSRIDGAKHAVILGGGLVGLKAAFALHKAGMDVTVVMRSSTVLSQMVNFDAAQIVMNNMNQLGMKILANADIDNIEEKNGSIAAVKVTRALTDTAAQSTVTLPCDILIVAKGVVSNTELIKDTRIEKRRGIITNSKMQTNMENIYSAGDVAETFDIATEQRNVNALWTCAVQQGKIAGLNMTGQVREYDGSLSMNSISFPGVSLISFGIVRADENADFEVLEYNPSNKSIYKQIVLKDNRIKGMILVGKIDRAGILLSLLRRRVDVGPFKDELLSDFFDYARIVARSGPEELLRYMNAGHRAGSG